MSVRLRVVLAVVALLAAACERPPAVHFSVAAGSTATNLLFLREPSPDRPMIRGVGVRTAGGRYAGSTGPLLWSMVADNRGELPAPDSLRYAAPPAGFTGSSASVLTPGEYRLEVQVGRHTTITYFRIANDGHAS